MRIIQIIIIVTLFMSQSSSFARDHKAFGAVQEVFAAMSSQDFEKMKGLLTHDFHLLESGEVWDMEALVNAFAGDSPDMKRRNFFKVIEMKEQGSSVWISYWNKAIITMGDNVRTVRWLESAVMVKDEGIWKVEMLHSTRLLENQSIPEGVELVEYVN